MSIQFLWLYSVDLRYKAFQTLDQMYSVHGLKYIELLAEHLSNDETEFHQLLVANEIKRQFTSPWKEAEKIKREKWITNPLELILEIKNLVSLFSAI